MKLGSIVRKRAVVMRSISEQQSAPSCLQLGSQAAPLTACNLLGSSTRVAGKWVCEQLQPAAPEAALTQPANKHLTFLLGETVYT